MAGRKRLSNHELALRVQEGGLRQLAAESAVFRKFVFTVFTEAGIFEPTYQRGSPHGTSYHEGRRALGLEVLHMLKNAGVPVLSLAESEADLIPAATQRNPGEPEDDLSNLLDDDTGDGEGYLEP